jgi:hypothetical protein
VALGKELENLIGKIFTTKQVVVNDLYGRDEEIGSLVVKLQESVLAMNSTRNFSEVVLTIYGARGQTYRLDEIIKSKKLAADSLENKEISQVIFSEVEADLIRTLGADIVVKPINALDLRDIGALRNALGSLGYLSE